MRFEVRVHPGSSKNLVKKESNGTLTVYITVAALENKANQALIKLLSEEFKVSKSSIKIIIGFKSKNKVVEIGV